MPTLTTMCDYEIAVFNAIEIVFPSANMMGCKYHLASAVNKHIGDCGLKTFYDRSLEFNELVHKFLALSYVPEEKVVDLFNKNILDYILMMINKETGDPAWIELSTNLLNFLNYLNFWVGKPKFNVGDGAPRLRRPSVFPLNTWNQFKSINQPGCVSTNNQLESFNRVYNSQVSK